MAFCFKQKESVSKAIRRLGRERVKDTLDCLKNCHKAEAVHGARKNIKKIRAALRLVRTQIDEKHFCRLKKLLRKAAGHLAAPRDAYVKARTLNNLMRQFKGQLPPEAMHKMRAQLRSNFGAEMKRFEEANAAKATERIMLRVAKELEDLDVRGSDWNALGPGVKTAYAEGRRAYQVALHHSSPENLHEWRKRAKDLWYQVALLRPIWPEQMDALARELETLGEYLGDDHDFAVLRETLGEQAEPNNHLNELFDVLGQYLGEDYNLGVLRRVIEREYGNDATTDQLEAVRQLVDLRQKELRAAAFALGARFYADKPSVFCNRLAGYWENWRGEKKSPAAPPNATS